MLLIVGLTLPFCRHPVILMVIVYIMSVNTMYPAKQCNTNILNLFAECVDDLIASAEDTSYVSTFGTAILQALHPQSLKPGYAPVAGVHVITVIRRTSYQFLRTKKEWLVLPCLIHQAPWCDGGSIMTLVMMEYLVTTICLGSFFLFSKCRA